MVSDGVDKNLLITKKSIFNERSTNSGSFTEILHDCWDLVSSTYNLRFLNFFLFKIQTCFEFSKICDSHSYIYIKYNHWNIYRLTLLILAEEILTFTGGSWCGMQPQWQISNFAIFLFFVTVILSSLQKKDLNLSWN